jgi:hypothetical protein
VTAGSQATRQVSVFESPTPSVDSVWQAWQAVLVAAQIPKPASRFRPSGVASL